MHDGIFQGSSNTQTRVHNLVIQKKLRAESTSRNHNQMHTVISPILPSEQTHTYSMSNNAKAYLSSIDTMKRRIRCVREGNNLPAADKQKKSAGRLSYSVTDCSMLRMGSYFSCFYRPLDIYLLQKKNKSRGFGVIHGTLNVEELRCKI